MSTSAQPDAGASVPGAQPTSRDQSLPLGRRVVAEGLGMFLLVLFHGGASAALKLHLHSTHASKAPSDLVYLALADGLSLFIIIMCVGKISGVLINPAVLLGLASAGRFAYREVLPYLAAELVGAVAGAATILIVFGTDAARIGHVGAVMLAPGMSIWQGMLIEGLGAFVLVLTISGTAEDPRAPDGWAGLAIGFTLAALVLFLEPATGSSFNPARAFGPAVVDALAGGDPNWAAYLVTHLLGPVLGSILAVRVYGILARQPAKKPVTPRTQSG